LSFSCPYLPRLESDSSTEVQTLQQRVRDLEQRLAALEKKLGNCGTSGAEVTGEIEQRLAKPEGKYDKTPGLESFEVFWKDGLRLQTEDRSFRMKIGGRIQNDWACYADKDDCVGELEDGTEFRRASIYIAGDIYEDIFFFNRIARTTINLHVPMVGDPFRSARVRQEHLDPKWVIGIRRITAVPTRD